jgi:two-component system, chemotaxis family, chemotaxis protein CheY
MDGENSRMARVLVVDDSHIMRKKIGKMLFEAGHEMVAEATNGSEAFEQYQALVPDAVTMDITMEGMDGISGVRQIVKTYPNAKIIMVTSIGHNDKVIQAISSGASYYLVKPIKQEKLEEALSKVLGLN